MEQIAPAQAACPAMPDGDTLRDAQILWDYLQLAHPLLPADCIIGFGCYNEDIPLRAAQLYHDGFAPRILFTGGLGRNTKYMWQTSEAERFAAIAISQGVPESAILIENQSTNTAENILFSRALLETHGISVRRVLGVHKPYMQRRIASAWPVYWPDGPEFIVTSFVQTMTEYMSAAAARGRSWDDSIHMLAGDFQRIDVYAEKGYQIPQEIPENVRQAFCRLIARGYTRQLVK